MVFKFILAIDGWDISHKISSRWMSLDLTDKSTLVQVMAWYHEATSHYLSQCWLRSMSPYGITRPPWVKKIWYTVSNLYKVKIWIQVETFNHGITTSCALLLGWSVKSLWTFKFNFDKCVPLVNVKTQPFLREAIGPNKTCISKELNCKGDPFRVVGRVLASPLKNHAWRHKGLEPG